MIRPLVDARDQREPFEQVGDLRIDRGASAWFAAALHRRRLRRARPGADAILLDRHRRLLPRRLARIAPRPRDWHRVR